MTLSEEDAGPGCLVFCQSLKLGFTVIPAQAGIQIAALDSRLRGNDVTQKLKFDKTVAVTSVTGEGPLGGFAAVAVRGQVQSAVSHP